jgi:hypothetical protein
LRDLLLLSCERIAYCLELLLEGRGDFDELRKLMSIVIKEHALRADNYLALTAEILHLLIRMLLAKWVKTSRSSGFL